MSTFADWHAAWRRLEPEHWPLFVQLELSFKEELRDALQRILDLEQAASMDRVALAERGAGAVAFLPDHDAEIAELRLTVAALRAFPPGVYNVGSS